MEKIEINCKGSGLVDIDKLLTFQGSLKKLEDLEFDKLKRSILAKGFCFPVFVWGDNIMDGHQRLFVLKSLINEGYEVGKIPVCEINANSKKEAAELLLRLNSHHGRITEDGLHGFLYDMDLDIEGIMQDLTLPDIDLDGFLDSDVELQRVPAETKAGAEVDIENIKITIEISPDTYASKRDDILKIINSIQKINKKNINFRVNE